MFVGKWGLLMFALNSAAGALPCKEQDNIQHKHLRLQGLNRHHGSYMEDADLWVEKTVVLSLPGHPDT